MSGTVPPIPSPLGTNTGNLASPNKIDLIPVDITNNTTTTNVVQNVLNEDLLKLLDSREAHEGPSDTRDTKIPALRLKFNAFKALEGERVNRTFTRLKCLLNDLENKCVSIPQAEVNAMKVTQMLSKTPGAAMNSWLISMLENQKRFYKRSGRIGSARKPIDKSNETCFACGKQGYFQKDCPSNKTSMPSYPS
ncbi:retrovirus-related pol polyprotein from transposon TNT 1-94 [Tanacetum coccineum]